MLRYERKAYKDGAKLVAGIDEAGRGPLAGPVMAAAVVLPREFNHDTLTDSKLLTARQRDRLFAELTNNPEEQKKQEAKKTKAEIVLTVKYSRNDLLFIFKLRDNDSFRHAL